MKSLIETAEMNGRKRWNLLRKIEAVELRNGTLPEMADDHDRIRRQDREFTERLKDELIRMELWADTGVNTGEVDKQHIYLSRIRGRIRMLLTEWEKRNEQDA